MPSRTPSAPSGGATSPSIRLLDLNPRELSETSAVARQALQYLGFSYGVTREWMPGVIDCSTLVSQSLWLAAAIRVPFKAEAQRLELSGREVDYLDLLPGDLVFSYGSAAESPLGRHNHVAMYLGADDQGHEWCIEASESFGAKLTRLDSMRCDGGFRRFCPHPDAHFPDGSWRKLARMVPKLGRIGCRLTAATPHHHRRHLGTDLVIEGAVQLRSPTDALLTRIVQGAGAGRIIELESSDPRVSTHVMGPIEHLRHRIGDLVSWGEVLGESSSTYMHGCNVTPLTRGRSRLHWEVWSANRPEAIPDYGLRFSSRATGLDRRDRCFWQAQNALYLLKQGVVGCPIGEPISEYASR